MIPFALEGQQKSLLKVKKNSCSGHLVFQNEAKNIPSQHFVMGNISCEFGSLPMIPFALEGQQKSLLKVKKTPVAAISFF